MYEVFLRVAITASLFPWTVQLHCCIPSQLETYVDELSFVPKGRGRTVVLVSTCLFLKLFTTLNFLPVNIRSLFQFIYLFFFAFAFAFAFILFPSY